MPIDRIQTVLAALQSGPLDRDALNALFPDVPRHRFGHYLDRWCQSARLTRREDGAYELGASTAKVPTVRVLPRIGDEEPAEDHDSNTWLLWTQAGHVDTFRMDDAMDWLDLERTPCASVIRIHVERGWLRIVERRAGVYARIDRGPATPAEEPPKACSSELLVAHLRVGPLADYHIADKMGVDVAAVRERLLELGRDGRVAKRRTGRWRLLAGAEAAE
jgi:hypothetical protein